MKRILCGVLIGLIAMSAHAEVDKEKETLYRVLKELSYVKKLMDEAEQAAPAGQRLKMNYDRMRADVDKMQTGIRERFSFTQIQPRVIEPLEGDYVSFVGEDQ